MKERENNKNQQQSRVITHDPETTSENKGLSLMPPPFQFRTVDHEKGEAQEKSDPPKKESPISKETIQRSEEEKPPKAKVAKGGGTHSVVKGDVLWNIAHKTYGHGSYWKQIKNANLDKVSGKGRLIYPNTVLDLPKIEMEKPVLDALRGASGDKELLAISQSVSNEDYQTFISLLTKEERTANAEFLQRVEMMRSSGMTMQELSDAQRLFLENQAALEGKSIGEYILDETGKHGYGGGTATFWNSLTPEEQKNWETRFDTLVSTLQKNAPDNVRAVIKEAENNGGGFVWEPEKNEIYGAFAFTGVDWKLYAGVRWVEAAEADLESVYANLVHEMGGHNEYGSETKGMEIMEQVLEDISDLEKTTAESGGNSIYSTYGYLETEIFAELREHEYAKDRTDNPTDYPFEAPVGTDKPREDDVGKKLLRIKEAFSPKVAKALVRGLHQRVQLDDRIIIEAKEMFSDRIQTVFGFDPR